MASLNVHPDEEWQKVLVVHISTAVHCQHLVKGEGAVQNFLLIDDVNCGGLTEFIGWDWDWREDQEKCIQGCVLIEKLSDSFWWNVQVLVVTSSSSKSKSLTVENNSTGNFVNGEGRRCVQCFYQWALSSVQYTVCHRQRINDFKHLPTS